MVAWRLVVAILAVVLGGVFLLVGIVPLIDCFAGGGRAACEPGPGILAPLVIGSVLLGVGNYLVYREYGVALGRFGGGGRRGGPPGRY